jgi:hypothetical protein
MVFIVSDKALKLSENAHSSIKNSVDERNRFTLRYILNDALSLVTSLDGSKLLYDLINLSV